MSLEKELEGWYVVYPGSEKLDLGPKAPVAYCKCFNHAEELVKKYGQFGYIERMNFVNYTQSPYDASRR